MLFLTIAGCDPPQGPLVTFHNLTIFEREVFIELLLEENLDEDGQLIQPYLLYKDHIGNVYKSSQQRRLYIDNAAYQPPETKYVVTAVLEDDIIVFQQVLTGAELMNPETVIEIKDER